MASNFKPENIENEWQGLGSRNVFRVEYSMNKG